MLTDFAEPLQLGGQKKAPAETSINEEGVAMILSMGFTRDQAIKALKAAVSLNWRTKGKWKSSAMAALCNFHSDNCRHFTWKLQNLTLYGNVQINYEEHTFG